jgi:hypothetical protein
MAVSSSNVQARYDVVLASGGANPRRVAPIIASFTELRRREAWELLQRAPVLILQGVGYATAQGAKEALERRGATVELRAYDMETAGPAPQSSTPPTSWLTVLGIVIAVIVILLIILAVVGTLIMANLGGDPTF